MTRTLCIVAAILGVRVAVMAAPPPQVVREAQARFERANRLYNEGRYTEALHLYQAAYDLIPSPDFLFNIGLAKEKTFDWEGCAQAMERFLREPAPDEQRERAKQRLESCRARVVIPVMVSSLPPSAAIYVGEGAERKLRGRTPARLELPPGSYVVTVEAPGYERQSERLTVEVGTRPQLDFMLPRLSSVRIESDVAGAVAQFEGGVPQPLPLQKEVPAGTYRVRVTKAGHQEVVRQVRVEAGQQVALVVTLPALPRLLTIASNVQAEVTIDGRPAGQTPLSRPLAAGSHRVEATAPGHVSLLADLVMREDRDVEARLEMRRRPSRWHLVVAGALAGAAVGCAVAATVYGSLALSDQHEYENGVPTRALRDQGERHARMADGFWIGAASAAAVAVVYYLLTRPRASQLVVGQ